MKALNARRQGDQKGPKEKKGLNGNATPFPGGKFFGAGVPLTGEGSYFQVNGKPKEKASRKEAPEKDDVKMPTPWAKYDVMEEWQDTRVVW